MSSQSDTLHARQKSQGQSSRVKVVTLDCLSLNRMARTSVAALDATDDFCSFVMQHVCAPLAEACAAAAVGVDVALQDAAARLHVAEALRGREATAALLRRVLQQLSTAESWSVREPRRQDTTVVVVARAPSVVPAAVHAATSAAGLPLKDAFPLRDAMADATATAITQYLSSDEHPLLRGLPAVALRRRLQCRHAGNGCVELVFPGSVDEMKAALPPSDALFKLTSFVLSRVSTFAADRDGELGFLPHAIVAGDGATGRLLAAAGVADAALPAPLPWTVDDVTLDSVHDFSMHADGTAGGDAMVPLSLWRVPRRLVELVCSWACDRGVTVSHVDVARAIRDDAVAAMSSFLGSDEGGRRVSLASRLRVVASSAAHALVVAFAGDVAALTGALEHVSRPAAMSVDEEASLRESEMLCNALHAAVFKLQLPLAVYLREQLPLFFEACVAASDVSVTDPDDARHIANAVYRVAGLPGDPLDDDWTDGDGVVVKTVLGDGRRIVAADGVGGGRVWTVSGAAEPLSSAVAVAVDDASLTAADKATASRVLKTLRDRGVSVAMPSSLGSGSWLRPPRRRDNKASGLRFDHLDRNKGKNHRDGGFDYSVRSWQDAAKLFLADAAHSLSSVDVCVWELTAMIWVMTRNTWLLRPLADRASVEEVKTQLLRAVGKRVGARRSSMSWTAFSQCMGTLIRLAMLCGESPSSSLLTELTDASRSPQSLSTPRAGDAPFPLCVDVDDEACVGIDSVIGRLAASLRRSSGADGARGGGGAGGGAVSGGGAGAGVGAGGRRGGGCACAASTADADADVGGGSGSGAGSRRRSQRGRGRGGAYAAIEGASTSAEVIAAVAAAAADDGPDAVAAVAAAAAAARALPIPVTARAARASSPACVHRLQVICGLAGVGKSTIARQLCRHMRDRRYYARGIFWLTGGGGVAGIQAAYLDMALQLRLAFDEMTPTTSRDALFAWMRTHDRWLLVLDDVADADAVGEWMPPADAQGHVVMTTRARADRVQQSAVLRGRSFDIVAVPCLDADASVSLLCQLCGRDVESLSHTDRLDARLLCVDELGGEPLAIKRAAAYARGHGVSFGEYLSMYQDCASASANGVDSSDRLRRRARATVELSMRSLDAASVEMLRLLCCLCADDVPIDAIVACVSSLPADDALRRLVFGNDSTTSASTSSAVSACMNALDALRENALVAWHASAALVSIPRVLQTVVWESCPVDVRETLAVACMDGVASGLQPLLSSVESDGLASAAAAALRRWLPHADAVQECARLCASASTERRLATYTAVVAAGMHLTLRLDDAQRLYRRSADLHRRLCGAGADDPAFASTLCNLANVLCTQGDVAESVRLHRESLSMRQRACGGAGTDHPAVAASLHYLARALVDQRKLSEAARLLRDAKAMLRRLEAASASVSPSPTAVRMSAVACRVASRMC